MVARTISTGSFCPPTEAGPRARGIHPPVTGTGDDWTTVKTFDFARSDDGTWSFSAPVTELADVDRILVVEEDHAPYDPAVPQPTAVASRVVYVEAIPGPFTTVPVNAGVVTDPGIPVN